MVRHFYLINKENISQDKLQNLIKLIGQYFTKEKDLDSNAYLRKGINIIYTYLLDDLTNKRNSSKKKKRKISKEDSYVSKKQINSFIYPKKIFGYKYLKIPFNSPLIFKKIIDIVTNNPELATLCKNNIKNDKCKCRDNLIHDFFEFLYYNCKDSKIEKQKEVYIKFHSLVNISCMNKNI